jgi:hypothetical protein
MEILGVYFPFPDDALDTFFSSIDRATGHEIWACEVYKGACLLEG